MARLMVALGLGVLFGVGLTVSQMVNPAKVIGFLDVTGHWDPSLALVMGGALLVTLPAFAVARRRDTPVLERAFHIPQKSEIDRRLVAGAVLFGVGWGLAGFCPGPALASMGLAEPATYPFVAAMIAGTLAARWLDPSFRARSAPLEAQRA
jgi:uncharacterized membrane protein YedE/YeeE